jgi:Family of unknown function (DUF5989)
MAEQEKKFESLGSDKRSSLMGEFIELLKHNKKWWLLPIIVVVLGLGALVLLGGTALAPFIYTLF